MTDQREVITPALEPVYCDLCRGNDPEPLYRVPECTGLFPGEIFTLVRCRKCGLVYINPRPPAGEQPKYYPAHTYSAFQNPRKLRISNRVQDLLREWAGGYRLAGDRGESRSRDLLSWAAWLAARLFMIEIVPWGGGKRMLDVGCGSGRRLLWYWNHGWEPYGVEIDPAAAGKAAELGLPVFRGELADAKYPADFFDVVTGVEVLEFVPSPAALLAEIQRVLRPGGLLLVSVANFSSYDREVYGGRWPLLDAPRRLYQFDHERLRQMLEAGGFAVTEVRTRGFWWPGLAQVTRFLTARPFDPLGFFRALWQMTAGKLFRAALTGERRLRFGVYMAAYARKFPRGDTTRRRLEMLKEAGSTAPGAEKDGEKPVKTNSGPQTADRPPVRRPIQAGDRPAPEEEKRPFDKASRDIARDTRGDPFKRRIN